MDDMLTNFVEKIVTLSDPVAQAIDGFKYYKGRLIEPPRATEPLILSTLAGFSDYVRSDRDGVESGKALIHIETPWAVNYVSKLEYAYRTREYYASAIYNKSGIFPFGQMLSLEDFNIKLMSLFDDTPARAEILEIVGNVRTDEQIEQLDDGVSQRVAKKAGVASTKAVTVKNPHRLQPHRTFAEVEQVESPFLLRLRKGPDQDAPVFAALFECDNGAWRVEAAERIRAWLKIALSSDPGVDVPVFA